MQVVSAGVHVLTAGQKVTLYQPKGAGSLGMPALSSVPAPQ
jgi:hypothetical protein